jgi:hypothetical protein
MKTSLTVLVLVLLLLSILAGCAPGPNPSRKIACVSMRSTAMDPGTTSTIYSAWPVSSEGAATGHHGGVVRARGAAEKIDD